MARTTRVGIGRRHVRGRAEVTTFVSSSDYNKWQATAALERDVDAGAATRKWRPFGWDAREIDGHDIVRLPKPCKAWPNGSGKPVALIAHTIKGKGVSFMEDDNNGIIARRPLTKSSKAHKELGIA